MIDPLRRMITIILRVKKEQYLCPIHQRRTYCVPLNIKEDSCIKYVKMFY